MRLSARQISHTECCDSITYELPSLLGFLSPTERIIYLVKCFSLSRDPPHHKSSIIRIIAIINHHQESIIYHQS